MAWQSMHKITGRRQKSTRELGFTIAVSDLDRGAEAEVCRRRSSCSPVDEVAGARIHGGRPEEGEDGEEADGGGIRAARR